MIIPSRVIVSSPTRLRGRPETTRFFGPSYLSAGRTSWPANVLFGSPVGLLAKVVNGRSVVMGVLISWGREAES